MSIGKVFISHSGKDKPFVDRLVSDLASHGVPVWYDKLDMKIGDSIPQKINEALLEAKYFLIVLSPNALESRWVKEELNAALMRQIASGGTFLLPVLYQECEIPPLLKHRNFADFRESYDKGIQDILTVWNTDTRASTGVQNKTLYPWPDQEISDSNFIYLYSTRFDKFFRMSCEWDWTINYCIQYIVETLKLPWEKNIPELGMKWSFSYGLIHEDQAIDLSTTLKGAGIVLGSVIKINISGVYEDLYEKELNEMWKGNKIYEIGGAMRRQAFLREAIASRGSLTQSALKKIADSCFSHV